MRFSPSLGDAPPPLETREDAPPADGELGDWDIPTDNFMLVANASPSLESGEISMNDLFGKISSSYMCIAFEADI